MPLALRSQPHNADNATLDERHSSSGAWKHLDLGCFDNVGLLVIAVGDNQEMLAFADDGCPEYPVFADQFGCHHTASSAALRRILTQRHFLRQAALGQHKQA